MSRWVVSLVLLLVGGAGGFYLGRKTAGPEGTEGASRPTPSSSPVAAAPKGAAPSAPLAAAPAPAQPAAPGAAPGSVTAPGAPAATPPSAPQGPLVRSIVVTLRGPLEESVAAALQPTDKAWASQLTQVVNRILVWSMQVARDGRKGDKLEVVFELPTAQPSGIVAIGEAGPATKEPIVLALRYGSQKLGKMLTAYRFKPEGSAFARYYTKEGAEVEDRLVDAPVDDYEQVTSLLRDGRRHKGVDYKTPVGTPVKAPFDGVVLRRNWHFSANGNCLEISDPKTGRKAIFLHLEAAPKEMQPGRAVKKGELIAKSGNSGHSTAPHLHYQLEAPQGKVLDPFAVLPTKKVTLSGASREQFEKERQRLEPMLVAAAR